MKKVLLFVAVAAMIFAAGTAQAAKKLPPKVIVGFETDQEFKDIYKENNGNRDYPVEKVTENVTQGKFACKLTFPNDGDWPGLHFVKFDGNWEGYDVLKVDVFNPSTEIGAFATRIPALQKRPILANSIEDTTLQPSLNPAKIPWNLSLPE